MLLTCLVIQPEREGGECKMSLQSTEQGEQESPYSSVEREVIPVRGILLSCKVDGGRSSTELGLLSQPVGNF